MCPRLTLYYGQVDADAAGLSDYHDIVTKPMDLGTVKGNLEGQKYEKEEEFREDVMLTFDNALKYNPDNDPCYQAAVRLKKKFIDIWAVSGEKFTEVGSAPSDNGSYIQKKDQGWGELLDLKLVKPGDTICAPRSGDNKGRHAQVQQDGTLLESGTESWIDPVAFCVSDNEWKESGSFLKDRNRFPNCTRICSDTQVQAKLRDLKDDARGRHRGSQVDDEEPDAPNLAPVQAAIVKVRMEVGKKIKWLKGKLIRLNRRTGEWDIKLEFCDVAPEESQGQCHGCSECLFKLAPDDRGW